jgi:hypothetical protein
MRVIADQQEDMAESAIVPRVERKTGRVEVSEVGQAVGQAESNSSATLTSSPEKDDDPNPASKTNTHHSPATAKAKEADRAVPMAVTPVIVEEPAVFPERIFLSDFSVAEMLQYLKASADDAKKRAKELRKAADELDPPAIGAPSIEAVREWASSEGIRDFDAEKFFNHYSLAGWKYGKAKTPIKDWRRAAANAYSGGKGWAVDGANRLPF